MLFAALAMNAMCKSSSENTVSSKQSFDFSCVRQLFKHFYYQNAGVISYFLIDPAKLSDQNFTHYEFTARDNIKIGRSLTFKAF